MRDTQQGFEHGHECSAGSASCGFCTRLVIQNGFREFKIPVTVFVPGELVDRLCGMIETVSLDGFGDVLDRLLQARDDPAIRQGECCFAARGSATVLALGIHEHVARGIPEFVAEVAVSLDTTGIQLDITAGCSQCCKGETQCVRAIGRYAFREVPVRHFLDTLRKLRLHHAPRAFGDE